MNRGDTDTDTDAVMQCAFQCHIKRSEVIVRTVETDLARLVLELCSDIQNVSYCYCELITTLL
jgi:hypothetical protein